MQVVTDFVKILELKRCSRQTIIRYKSHLIHVQRYFKDIPLKNISDKDLFEYIYYLVNVKGISASYQRQIVSGLKLFYKEIFNRVIPFEYLKVTQRERKLPLVLSKSEVANISLYRAKCIISSLQFFFKLLVLLLMIELLTNHYIYEDSDTTMNKELYESIKGYIKKYKSFKVGYFPSPIPDLDIEFEHSDEFPELMEMLVSFWWDEFALKCEYCEGWYEFQLKSAGDILVLSNSFENNSWDEEGAFAFVEQLIDYGFYKYLNKFFTKKYIDSLIENEGFPEDVRPPKHMEDYISSLIDLKMEYNTKLGFKKFDFYFDDCKVHPSSRHFFFIRKLMKKTLNELTNNGSYPADINSYDENKLDITFYNDFSFEITRPV